MTQDIVFIQGGGQGAYAEDQGLVDQLRTHLVDKASLSYPEFPGLEQLQHDEWAAQADLLLSRLTTNTLIVAHSLGGAALLKRLSELAQVDRLTAVFLIAVPYKCTDGEWGSDDFAIDVDFAARLPPIDYVFMYHSRDDEWVPFAHLERYHQKLPNAVVRAVDGQGHMFTNKPFNELVQDIRSVLAERRQTPIGANPSRQR